MDIDNKIIQTKITLHHLVYTDWINNDLFSPRWFGTVAFILFSYVLCFWLLDKSRFTQILLFGSLMTVMVTLMNVFGTQFVLWTYLTRIFPIIPSLFLYDFTIIPLYYMLVYQYSSNWKSFAIWDAVLAGIISFGVYPLLTLLKMFKLNNWQYPYFFPFIFAFGLLGRAVVMGIVAIEENRIKIHILPHYDKNLVPDPAMKPLTNSKKDEDKLG